jgi:hypothetical protein
LRVQMPVSGSAGNADTSAAGKQVMGVLKMEADTSTLAFPATKYTLEAWPPATPLALQSAALATVGTT